MGIRADDGGCHRRLKKEGYEIFALEQSKRSVPYYRKPRGLRDARRCPRARDRDHPRQRGKGIAAVHLARRRPILEIPMMGKKESLNVAVAFGIVAFGLRFGNGAGDSAECAPMLIYRVMSRSKKMMISISLAAVLIFFIIAIGVWWHVFFGRRTRHCRTRMFPVAELVVVDEHRRCCAFPDAPSSRSPPRSRPSSPARIPPLTDRASEH